MIYLLFIIEYNMYLSKQDLKSYLFDKLVHQTIIFFNKLSFNIIIVRNYNS